MSGVSRRPVLNKESAAWLLALTGFAAMYFPSYWGAANGLWQSDELGHAPIILVVVLWLFWQGRDRVLLAPDDASPVLGGLMLMLGLLMYGFGRIFTMSSVEFLSQPIVVAAVLLLLKGPTALRAVWFAVFYLVFMVPLPATLVDAVTGPLKQWISFIVVDVLFVAGYPIARTGVTITIGPYQLLVADACSGLNSMFSLSALGAVFMYIMARKSSLHNAIMIAAIAPIAFTANLVRVTLLVLLTYYFGDEAGQGFLHGASGILLMLVALGILFALDAMLTGLLAPGRQSRRPDASTAAQADGGP